ncbi:aromatic-ring opening dioxygenase LigAB LigA subunit [Rhodoglobus vestalii]|uniref:Aromatic-ring opening dioxygenase LigAB LigA subunit n=1 Tax=Rhodoglobus vestalii TaxID=193384 RepID=A0A8H2PXA3_9MICO|nr:hypothetical protein [Rhodoglobus vestalii]TQO20035.1 aromatic-ring opening dioxygenase LigAB LigA subunit [Rhodoglobus vestalii]
MYSLHKLLWEIRKDPELAKRFRADPSVVLNEYGLEGDAREAMLTLDFKKLHEIGANPYLIYFCALQLQVGRESYYEQIREGKN